MEEEYEVLDEIRQKKGKKTFESVINSSKFSKFELDEAMMED